MMRGFLALCSLIFSLLVVHANAPAQWEEAEITQLTSNDYPNAMVGLYVDRSDQLHLLYTETGPPADPQTRLFYRTEAKGGSWSEAQDIGVPAFVFAAGARQLIKFDPRTQRIHVVFIPPPGSGIYYSSNQIPGWEFTLVDSLASGKFNGMNMALDSLDNVHLVWELEYDSIGHDSVAYNWLKVIYADNSTGAWVKQQVSRPIWLGFSGSSSIPVPLGVESNGTAHILYQDWQEYWYHAGNDHLGGEAWATDSTAFPPGWHSGGPISFVVDQEDNLHMCLWGGPYPFETLSYLLYYSRAKNSAGWEEPDTVTQTGISPQLFVRSLVPHLCWRETDGTMVSSNIMYANKNGAAWLVYKIIDEEPLYPEDFGFAVDSEGTGHGAFWGWKQYMVMDSTEIYYFGSGDPMLVEGDEDQLMPRGFHLFQNYPNPFNQATTIRYRLRAGEAGHVSLKIFNVRGEQVADLPGGGQDPGDHVVTWDGKDGSGRELASGIYFYVLSVGDKTQTKKLVLLK